MQRLAIELEEDHLIMREDYSRSPIIHKEIIIRPSVQPVVKWAGGKQWLAVAAPLLVSPQWSGRYYEPFIGGGAFFFALEPGRALYQTVIKSLLQPIVQSEMTQRE